MACLFVEDTFQTSSGPGGVKVQPQCKEGREEGKNGNRADSIIDSESVVYESCQFRYSLCSLEILIMHSFSSPFFMFQPSPNQRV